MHQIPGTRRWGKWEDIGYCVQTWCYKLNKFRDLMYNMLTIVSNNVLNSEICNENRF